MKRWRRLLSGALVGLVLMSIVLLNVQSQFSHYPRHMLDIDDAPYASPVVAEKYYNGEYRAVYYGFPWPAYERWWHRNDPSRVTSEILIGAVGNLFIHVSILVLLGKVFRAMK